MGRHVLQTSLGIVSQLEMGRKKANGSNRTEPPETLGKQHSVHGHVLSGWTVLSSYSGRYLCVFSPTHARPAIPGEWTRRDLNPHLRLGQSAVFPLHHGPTCSLGLQGVGNMVRGHQTKCDRPILGHT